MRLHAEQRGLSESPRSQKEEVIAAVEIALELGQKGRLVDIKRARTANVWQVILETSGEGAERA